MTLEGNFAAAEGLHQMLLQSQGGVIRLFPAVPETWEDISFDTLRAEGAFLVTAERFEGARLAPLHRVRGGGYVSRDLAVERPLARVQHAAR